MTTQLQHWLGDGDGMQAFDRWFGGVMRGGDRDELDAFLTEELLAHPHRISSLCLSRPLATVRVTGWDELAVDLADEEARHAEKGPVTAIGADLSDHCDPDDDSWPLEVSFYDDEVFAFGAGDLAAINAEAAKTGTAWQGGFRDIGNSLTVVGLGRIYHAIGDNAPGYPQRGTPASIDQVADRLGRYFITLRFHQALVRDAAHHGLPRAMVLLGGAHDVAPWYEAAYWCDRMREDDGRVASLLAAREATKKAHFRAETEKMIKDWRDRRNAIVRRQLRADKHQQFADYSAARDALFASSTGLGDGRPAHDLSDHEFEMLLHAWRRQRADMIGDDPDAIPVPEKPRGGLFSLFRRAS